MDLYNARNCALNQYRSVQPVQIVLYGAFYIFISTLYEGTLDTDFKATATKLIVAHPNGVTLKTFLFTYRWTRDG